MGPSLTLLVVLGLVIGLTSESGRGLMASAIQAATGGQVQITNLGGALPFAPRIERLVLADAEGPWLRVDDAALSLAPRALLNAELEIQSLTAGCVTLLRRPATSGGSSTSAWPLPLAIQLQHLEIGKLQLSGVVEAAPDLAIQGSAALARDGNLQANLAITPAPAATLDRFAFPGRAASSSPVMTPGRISDLVLLDLMGSVQSGALALTLGESHWSGIDVHGQLRWAPAQSLPIGELALDVAQLARLEAVAAPWLAPSTPLTLGGRLKLRLMLNEEGRLEIDAEGADLSLPHEIQLASLVLQAEVDALLVQPRVRSTLRVTGVEVPGLAGDFAVKATGPTEALELNADARLQLAQVEERDQQEEREQLAQLGRLKQLGTDQEIRLSGSGRLQAFERQLHLSTASLELQRHGLRLLEPARIDFGDGLSIDAPAVQLLASNAMQTTGRGGGQLGASGQFGISGRLAPALGLDARVIDLPLATLIALLPSTAAPPAPLGSITGLIDLETHLDGPATAPLGRLDLLARELRWSKGLGHSLPPGELRLALQRSPTATTIEAQGLVGDRASLELAGQLGAMPSPLDNLRLRARGQIDAALFNPVLSAGGRQLDGQLSLDLGIGGRLAQPLFDGSVDLRNAAWRDRRLGLVLTEIDGRLQLAGETLRVERLSASAGPGNLRLTGTLGWLSPDQPVDLRLIARKASPFQLDLLQLQADADLRLRGALARGTVPQSSELSGDIQFERIDLRIPDRLPVTVAHLEVKEVGVRRQPRSHRQLSHRTNGDTNTGWSPAAIGLDLLISAPQALSLTGRGIDAELGGEIRASGSLAEPAIVGDFRLLRGDYALVGQQLRFTRGRIGFDGASVLDPTLDLEARVQAAGATAILAVEGTARAPEIHLTGEPEMPEDEVLSRLLFGLSRSRLSALQVTRLGLAAASLAGIEGPAIGLLERTRSGLGLDRLGIGQNADGARPGSGDSILEGGRYLSERVYLGARQGTRPGETQGILRMQLNPRIRLETDVGADGGARAGAAFELEY